MTRYRKLFACVVGVAALITMRHLDVTIPGIDAIVVELVVGVLTSFGVYQATNES